MGNLAQSRVEFHIQWIIRYLWHLTVITVLDRGKPGSLGCHGFSSDTHPLTEPSRPAEVLFGPLCLHVIVSTVLVGFPFLSRSSFVRSPPWLFFAIFFVCFHYMIICASRSERPTGLILLLLQCER